MTAKHHCPLGRIAPLAIIVSASFASSLPTRATYQATITADCNGNTGAIDKAKLLNVARGGQGINSDLTWMPSFLDKLVEIGVREFRIDWLLGDNFYSVVSRNGSGQLAYNFSKLDQIIIPLAQRGIKPIMCMGQMASALGPTTGGPQLRGIQGGHQSLCAPLHGTRLLWLGVGIPQRTRAPHHRRPVIPNV